MIGPRRIARTGPAATSTAVLLRFSYGVDELYEGLPLVAVALGIFGLPGGHPQRRLDQGPAHRRQGHHAAFRLTPDAGGLAPGPWGAIFRGTGASVSFFRRPAPAAGGLLASLHVLFEWKNGSARIPASSAREPSKGWLVRKPPTMPAVQTAFIPTLTLGIPGDVVMAIMLGALMIHGIQPGAAVITSHPDLFWGLLVSFLFGNIFLIILNVPLIGLWVRLLSIPYSVLYPFIIAFICIGVYSVNSSVLDLYVLIFFGVLGCLLAYFRFEPAPLILGLILGPMLEVNMRRALMMSRGDYTVFISRPISAIFLGAGRADRRLDLVGRVSTPSRRKAPAPGGTRRDKLTVAGGQPPFAAEMLPHAT